MNSIGTDIKKEENRDRVKWETKANEYSSYTGRRDRHPSGW